MVGCLIFLKNFIKSDIDNEKHEYFEKVQQISKIKQNNFLKEREKCLDVISDSEIFNENISHKSIESKPETINSSCSNQQVLTQEIKLNQSIQSVEKKYAKTNSISPKLHIKANMIMKPKMNFRIINDLGFTPTETIRTDRSSVFKNKIVLKSSNQVTQDKESYSPKMIIERTERHERTEKPEKSSFFRSSSRLFDTQHIQSLQNMPIYQNFQNSQQILQNPPNLKHFKSKKSIDCANHPKMTLSCSPVKRTINAENIDFRDFKLDLKEINDKKNYTQGITSSNYASSTTVTLYSKKNSASTKNAAYQTLEKDTVSKRNSGTITNFGNPISINVNTAVKSKKNNIYF